MPFNGGAIWGAHALHFIQPYSCNLLC